MGAMILKCLLNFYSPNRTEVVRTSKEWGLESQPLESFPVMCKKGGFILHHSYSVDSTVHADRLRIPRIDKTGGY